MFKYMKYEIKGTYKFISGALLLAIILFTVIYTYFSRKDLTSSFGNILVGLSIMVLFGTALTVFLYIVNSFRKELYEDSGYLTFTLPLTGNQIVGSKLIVALMWFIVSVIFIAVYNLLMVVIFHPFEMNIAKLFSSLHGAAFRAIIMIAFTAVFSGIQILILIYFSMTLSRVTFRNKKIGGFWFILFLVLVGVLGFGDNEITKLLPYYLDFNTFHINTSETLNSHYQAGTNIDRVNIGVSGFIATNIASWIYNFATTVALFLGTSYLIERKINL